MSKKEETTKQIEEVATPVDVKKIPKEFIKTTRRTVDELVKIAHGETTEETVLDPNLGRRAIVYQYFNTDGKPIAYVYSERDSQSIWTEYHALKSAQMGLDLREDN